jgi:phosphoglycerate dehydrogenase-like enzyme|tara:strand:+ start:115 stop:321 length:207 start_codon:yes stop_codon:yes gene_type:complete
MSAIELTGGTLGIIGLGGFGLEMIKRASGYGMTILAIDPVRQDKPLKLPNSTAQVEKTYTIFSDGRMR